ncbi:WD domain, G-beta repeat-containing protein [Toxoplasma gondii TgCatPRC2]|uniref:WD domain, G-beta repeat-containing protein n=1 Tax=Toxoplasma gondii TgCatPRC2 TaxID=1130821 RepID=A0A151HKY9_TOXGO|nr:WD domain, G-beta repeat-containing protein [Toxoplasma gondii TgCatPRC2]
MRGRAAPASDAFYSPSSEPSSLRFLRQNFATARSPVCVVRIGSVDLVLPLPPFAPRECACFQEATDSSLSCFASPFSHPLSAQRAGEALALSVGVCDFSRPSTSPGDSIQRVACLPSCASSSPKCRAREGGLEDDYRQGEAEEKLKQGHSERTILVDPGARVCACKGKQESSQKAEVNVPARAGSVPCSTPPREGQERKLESSRDSPRSLARREVSASRFSLADRSPERRRGEERSESAVSIQRFATKVCPKEETRRAAASTFCCSLPAARLLHERVVALLSPEERVLPGRLRHLRAGRPGLLVLDTDELCPLQHFLFERPVARVVGSFCFLGDSADHWTGDLGTRERRGADGGERLEQRSTTAVLQTAPFEAGPVSPEVALVGSVSSARPQQFLVLEWPLPPCGDAWHNLPRYFSSLSAFSSPRQIPLFPLCGREAPRASGHCRDETGDFLSLLPSSAAVSESRLSVSSGAWRPDSEGDTQAFSPRATARCFWPRPRDVWSRGPVVGPREDILSDSDDGMPPLSTPRRTTCSLCCRPRLSSPARASRSHASPALLSGPSRQASGPRAHGDALEDGGGRLDLPSGLGPAPQRLRFSGAEVTSLATTLVAHAFEPFLSSHSTATAAGVLLASLLSAFTASVTGALTTAAAVVAAHGGAGASSAAAALSSACVHSDYAFDEEDEEGGEQDGLATLFAFLFLESSHCRLPRAPEEQQGTATARAAASSRTSPSQTGAGFGENGENGDRGAEEPKENAEGEGELVRGAEETGEEETCGACGKGTRGDSKPREGLGSDAGFLNLPVSLGLVALFSNISFSSWIAACSQLVAASRLLSVIDREKDLPSPATDCASSEGEESKKGQEPWGETCGASGDRARGDCGWDEARDAGEACKARGERTESCESQRVASGSPTVSKGKRQASVPALRPRKICRPFAPVLSSSEDERRRGDFCWKTESSNNACGRSSLSPTPCTLCRCRSFSSFSAPSPPASPDCPGELCHGSLLPSAPSPRSSSIRCSSSNSANLFSCVSAGTRSRRSSSPRPTVFSVSSLAPEPAPSAGMISPPSPSLSPAEPCCPRSALPPLSALSSLSVPSSPSASFPPSRCSSFSSLSSLSSLSSHNSGSSLRLGASSSGLASSLSENSCFPWGLAWLEQLLAVTMAMLSPQKTFCDSAGVAAAAGLTAWLALAATGSPGAAALAATASFVASGKAKLDGSWILAGERQAETERRQVGREERQMGKEERQLEMGERHVEADRGKSHTEIERDERHVGIQLGKTTVARGHHRRRDQRAATETEREETEGDEDMGEGAPVNQGERGEGRERGEGSEGSGVEQGVTGRGRLEGGNKSEEEKREGRGSVERCRRWQEGVEEGSTLKTNRNRGGKKWRKHQLVQDVAATEEEDTLGFRDIAAARIPPEFPVLDCQTPSSPLSFLSTPLRPSSSLSSSFSSLSVASAVSSSSSSSCSSFPSSSSSFCSSSPFLTSSSSRSSVPAPLQRAFSERSEGEAELLTQLSAASPFGSTDGKLDSFQFQRRRAATDSMQTLPFFSGDCRAFGGKNGEKKASSTDLCGSRRDSVQRKRGGSGTHERVEKELCEQVTLATRGRPRKATRSLFSSSVSSPLFAEPPPCALPHGDRLSLPEGVKTHDAGETRAKNGVACMPAKRTSLDKTPPCFPPCLLSRLLHAPLASAHRLGFPSLALLLFLRIRLPAVVARRSGPSQGTRLHAGDSRASLCGVARPSQSPRRHPTKELSLSLAPEFPGGSACPLGSHEPSWRPPALASEDIELGLLLSREATISDLLIHIFVSLCERGLLPWTGGDDMGKEDDDVDMHASSRENCVNGSPRTPCHPGLVGRGRARSPATMDGRRFTGQAGSQGSAGCSRSELRRSRQRSADRNRSSREESRQTDETEERRRCATRAVEGANVCGEGNRGEKHAGKKKTLFRAWLVSTPLPVSSSTLKILPPQPAPETQLVRDCRFFFGERLCLVLSPVPFPHAAAELPSPLVLEKLDRRHAHWNISSSSPLASPRPSFTPHESPQRSALAASASRPCPASEASREEEKLVEAVCATRGGRSESLSPSSAALRLPLTRSSRKTDEKREDLRKTSSGWRSPFDLETDEAARKQLGALEKRIRDKEVPESETEEQEENRIPRDLRAGDGMRGKDYEETDEETASSRRSLKETEELMLARLPSSSSSSSSESSLRAAAAWLASLSVDIEKPEPGSPVFVLFREDSQTTQKPRGDHRPALSSQRNQPFGLSPHPRSVSSSSSADSSSWCSATKTADMAPEDSREPTRASETNEEGNSLATSLGGTGNRSLRHRDETLLACNRRLLRSTANARQFEFHPDFPEVILTGHKDGSIRIVDCMRDRAVAGLCVDSGPILGLSWLSHHPGRLVCAASATGAPYFVSWDLSEFLGGEERREKAREARRPQQRWSRGRACARGQDVDSGSRSPTPESEGLWRDECSSSAFVEDAWTSSAAEESEEEESGTEGCFSEAEERSNGDRGLHSPRGRRAFLSSCLSRCPRERAAHNAGGPRRGSGLFGSWTSSSTVPRSSRSPGFCPHKDCGWFSASRSSAGLRVVHTGVSFDQQLSSLSVSCTDDFLLLSGFSTNLSLYDVATGQRLGALQRLHTGSINTVRFSSSSPHVFATASFDQTCKVWDLRQRIGLSAARPTAFDAFEEEPGRRYPQRPWQAFRPRAWGASGGDSATAVPVQTFSTGSPNVMCAFSDDGLWVLCSGVDTVLRQYALRGCKAVPDRFELPSARANAATNFRRSFYLRGSRRFVTAGTEESCVRIFDVQSGANLGNISFEGLLSAAQRRRGTPQGGPERSGRRRRRDSTNAGCRREVEREREEENGSRMPLRSRGHSQLSASGRREASLDRRLSRDYQVDRPRRRSLGAELTPSRPALSVGRDCRREETSFTRSEERRGETDGPRRNGRRFSSSILQFASQETQEERQGDDADDSDRGSESEEEESRERLAAPSRDLGNRERRTQLSESPLLSLFMPSLYSPEVWTRAASFAAAGGEFFFSSLRDLYVHFQWRLLQLDRQNEWHLREDHVQTYTPNVPASEEYIQSLRGHPSDDHAFAALVAMPVNTPYSGADDRAGSAGERRHEREASAQSQMARTQRSFVVLTELANREKVGW